MAWHGVCPRQPRLLSWHAVVERLIVCLCDGCATNQSGRYIRIVMAVMSFVLWSLVKEKQVRSFVRSVVRSFARACVRAFVRSFVCWLSTCIIALASLNVRRLTSIGGRQRDAARVRSCCGSSVSSVHTRGSPLFGDGMRVVLFCVARATDARPRGPHSAYGHAHRRAADVHSRSIKEVQRPRGGQQGAP